MATAVSAIQEATLKGLVSPIGAYSCDLHVLDTIQDSKQVACMTPEDWHWAQEADPVLSLVITRLRDGMQGKSLRQQTSQNQSVPVGASLLAAQKGCPIQASLAQRLEETLLQLVLPAAQREVALRGCHDEVCHLGLEHKLDLMHDRFFLPCMAA